MSGDVAMGLYSKTMFSFEKKEKNNCVFQCDSSIFHSHWQRMKVPVVPHPCQYLVSSVFSDLAILVDVSWYFFVVLICNSLAK